MIAFRTSEYARKGIYVLWLGQWTPYLDADRYSPRLWEKWVHAAYFGRVYYWTEDLSVVPYRFEPRYMRIDRSHWDLEHSLAGTGADFRRISKRYRMPSRGETLHLIHDF